MRVWPATLASCAGLGVALLAQPQMVRAQAIVGVYGSQVWSDNRDLPELLGVGASLRLPELPISLSLDWSSGKLRRTGVPCAGLVAPGTCAVQLMEVRSSIAGASAGWRFVVRDFARTEIAATPELGFGIASVRYTGLQSAEEVDGGKLFIGIGGTLLVTVRPVARVPLGLTLSVRVRSYEPVGTGRCVDCFQPFQRSIGDARLQAGMSYLIRGSD